MPDKHFVHTNPGLVAEWSLGLDQAFLCLVPDRRAAEKLYVNLEAIHGEQVELLPDWNRFPDEDELPGKNIQDRRLTALAKVAEQSIRGLVAPVRALASPVLKPESLPVLTLDRGEHHKPRKLARRLTELGFQRQNLAQERGDFALRGDLLDIFPENFRQPVRLNFFDEEITSIEFFHPSTQMQAEEEPDLPLKLTLQSEFALSQTQREQLTEKLKSGGFPDQAEILEFSPRPHQAPDWFGLWPRATRWLEQLLNKSTKILYAPGDCLEAAQVWDKKLTDFPAGTVFHRTYRKLTPLLHQLTSVNSAIFSRLPQKSELTGKTEHENLGEAIELRPKASPEPQPIEDFLERIRELCGGPEQIVVHCGESTFRQRLGELLAEELGSADSFRGTDIKLVSTSWRGSCRLDSRGRLSLDDFFDRTITRGQISTSAGSTEYLKSFEELDPGDLVVHEDFGIGRFKGLEMVSTEKQTRDCIHIEYADGDRLYLPPDQMSRVQKYIADSGFNPPLSSLGSTRWQKVKERVKDEIDDLAEELLELYARREEGQTEPYPPDNLEQTQFEASFPYHETPDQRESIQAVKQDLESSEPMDRLICGDSGYGKTEVALRAAFKAITNGRQVAILVPTTVLARQHFETFSNRFSFFPYRVELLSRFQKEREISETISGLESGEVDLVVGTHTLIKRDLEFDDLGLLIIDEEQRFGVKQKEQLKLERKELDVLTLSATPIPRTLYMSLSGIQDISVINTPPEDRIPIQVQVGAYESQRAADALEHELDRGGQVFWVYNRVKDIELEAEKVRALVPGAAVEYAHGQLSKQKLRQKMNQFYSGETDVLVTTTIVESGLDCPNVNTMVVRKSHKFGLAQLYQLRGRIGRSHEQAHAYLFYPSEERLTEDAEARLKTIKQCSEMGSGYELAMRDLEIRGAGNLLGRNQHGNIRAVGFPFYCRLLQRSIRRLKEGFEAPEALPRLKLPGQYYIPRDYIPDEKQIIAQYRALASCRNFDDLAELAKGWRETFGPLPEPVNQALRRHAFKLLAENRGWEDIQYRNKRLNLRYTEEKPDILAEAAREVGAYPTSRGNRFFIRSLGSEKVQKWLGQLVENQLNLLDL